MTTWDQMVEQVRSNLQQHTAEQYATFKGWVLDGSSTKVGIKLADVGNPSEVNNSLVEIPPELVHVTSFDADSTVCTCPPWFRQQQGSPASDPDVDTRAVIKPRWPWWRISRALVSGVHALEPDLFQVKTQEVTSSVTSRRYAVAADTEEILSIRLLLPGPNNVELPIKRWSLDVKATDGNRYLHMDPIHQGQPIRIKYRAKAIVPDGTDPTTTWASTGLPASAERLPILYATASLLPAAEASRTQTSSIEQSTRARFIQSGSATAPARFWMQEFQAGLLQERRNLLDQHGPEPHFELLGG
jgi:hypothetical protein